LLLLGSTVIDVGLVPANALLPIYSSDSGITNVFICTPLSALSPIQVSDLGILFNAFPDTPPSNALFPIFLIPSGRLRELMLHI
jgi:hypothetical protein